MRSHWAYTFGATTYDFRSRTHLMGILNVTPDSFSDGGRYVAAAAAVDRALEMIDEGADIIDVGGESTRPKSAAYGEGAGPVDAEEELRRILPVIAELAKRTAAPISVDTWKAAVAERAIDAGATIVNDISGFHFDEAMADTVARKGASAILMHIKGTPGTMQDNPSYKDVVAEVKQYLAAALTKARGAGVRQLFVDPGIGFGKNHGHNLRLIRELRSLGDLEYPVVVGISRKSVVGTLVQRPVDERLHGSVAAAVVAVMNGAHVLRVHDVDETKQAVLVADAFRNADVSPVE